jgi:hypothetical protein
MEFGFDKTYLPIWCKDCDQQGYIFIDDPELSYFVKCKSCSWETSEVWCPSCEMGGEFVRHIGKRPSYWVCTDCKTKYQLPDGFYENPINLFPVEDLPIEVSQRIDSEQSAWHSAWRKQQFYAIMILALGIASLVIPWFLMVKSLNFLPLPMRPIGLLIVTILGVFWLFCWKYLSKSLKNKIAQWSPINRLK